MTKENIGQEFKIKNTDEILFSLRNKAKWIDE